MKPVLKPETARKGVSPQQNREYVQKLSRMINCKTVWTREGTYEAEYARFYAVLEELFPTLTAGARKLTFGGGCFFYVVEGKNAKKNVLLMSHHDVVDGGDGWETDPFEAVEKNGYLYGRGTIDTKTPLFAQLQACEELLQAGYDFEGINLWIGSSNNEEICGDGMVLATQYFREQGIRFDTVLDEGGAITEGQIPGVKCKSAVVAVHEKSRHVFRCRAALSAKGHGGFGGAKDSAVERLSRFIAEVSQKSKTIYKGKFYPEVRATFERHVPYMAFPMNFLFGNIGIFAPIIKKIMMGIPAASAMLSTGVSFTTLQAGNAQDPQLRAKTAEATMFLRCIREEDLYAGLAKIKKIAAKYGVEVDEVERDYCRPTDFRGEAYTQVEALLHENFPDVAVVPFLLTAGTDARRFSDLADNILRFAPIDLNKKQFATIHEANEHIGIENIGQCVMFYKDFVKQPQKQTPAEQLVSRLAQKNWHISFAESCTGGLAAAGIVDVPSASSVFDRSYVTYANEAKIEDLGVPAETVRANGVVSEPVAAEMAKGAAKKAAAQVGVGISGIAGPSGGSKEKPVGTVCFGFYVDGELRTATKHFGNIGRNAVREASVAFVYETLLNLLA